MVDDKYIINAINNHCNIEHKKNKISVALIGLGPHAKRIYLNFFQKYKINLTLLVDLTSKKSNIRKYLDDKGFNKTRIFTIDDSIKDLDHLPKEIFSNLRAICDILEITHIVIATEPKAHNMYLEFALKNNIDVLTDKPITVTKNMTNFNSINKIRKQYYDIYKLAEHSNALCKVMCQRQYHKGYEYIKEVLSDVVKKYQIPITYIDIYHCDGNWEMPHDLLKENHPYKYGYGKLFHSGYHFIDLLSDLIKINNQLPQSKKITKGEIYSNCFTPNDELAVFNVNDYKRIFKSQKIPEYYKINTNPKFNKFGEKNFYGLLKFTNSHNQTITNVDLNLLHYGFSRRGWIESRDFYKKNGRIRHERINIQVGTLMNIQIHSYQSKQIEDRSSDNLSEEQVGGLEHFDIDIYRNIDIIGGKPYERITLGNLYTDNEKKNMLGYNELARETYLTNFFSRKCEKGDIKDQALAIEILYSCAMGIKNYYNNVKKPEKIRVRNKYTYPIKLKELKKHISKDNINEEKKILKYYKIEDDEYAYGSTLAYLNNKKSYEAYLHISDDDDTASGLFYKEIKNKFLAYIYYYIICILAYKKNIKKISDLLDKTTIEQNLHKQ